MIVRDSLRLGFVSLHTSPLADPGQADAGGMNVYEANAALALARRGHQVDIYTRRSDPDTPTIVDVSAGVRVIHLDAGPSTPLAKSAMEIAIAPFRESLAAALAHEGTYDVLHCHHWFSGVAALPVARSRGIPVATSFHSVAAPATTDRPEEGEPAESSGRIAGERLAASQADLVVAISQAEANTISRRYGVANDEIAVVVPGVDVEAFHPATTQELRDRLDQPPYLLFAARLQPLKGPDLALETLAALPAAHRDTRLVLAGAASADFADLETELRDRARALDVAERVIFAGPQGRTALADLMRHAALFLLPSWSETFGLVALESQASGVPVIAWRGAGGPPEAMSPGGGILLDSRDPRQWAGAVAGVLDDAQGRAAQGRAGRAFAEVHSWDNTAHSLLQAYATVIAR